MRYKNLISTNTSQAANKYPVYGFALMSPNSNTHKTASYNVLKKRQMNPPVNKRKMGLRQKNQNESRQSKVKSNN